jgi:hypothetical protein
MSPRPPDGEPAPRDGALPRSALARLATRPFGVYVHVPFCASRCQRPYERVDRKAGKQSMLHEHVDVLELSSHRPYAVVTAVGELNIAAAGPRPSS